MPLTMRLKLMTVRLPWFCLALLMGCASPPPIIEIQKEQPPAALLTCPDAPAVPTGGYTQKDVALYVTKLYGAWDGCKKAIGDVAGWAKRI